MIALQGVHLVLMALLGTRVAFEDWTLRRIRNRWILWILGCCAAGYGFWLACTVLALSNLSPFGSGFTSFHPRFYALVLLHFGLSAAAGVALWYMKVWPAGDAKFFIALSLWVPLVDPLLRAFPKVLFLLLLFNAFLFSAGYVALSALAVVLRGLTEPGRQVLGRAVSAAWEKALGYIAEFRSKPASAALLALETLVLFLALRVGMVKSGGLLRSVISSEATAYVTFFVLWNAMGRILSNRWVGWFLIVSFLSYTLIGFVDFPERLRLELADALRMLANFWTLLIVGRTVLDLYFDFAEVERVDARELQPGMILAESEVRNLVKDQDLRNGLGTLYSDGLSAEQVETLKAWAARGARERVEVAVSRAHPFAVWIFAGTLFTLLARQDLLLWLGLGAPGGPR